MPAAALRAVIAPAGAVLVAAANTDGTCVAYPTRSEEGSARWAFRGGEAQRLMVAGEMHLGDGRDHRRGSEVLGERRAADDSLVLAVVDTDGGFRSPALILSWWSSTLPRTARRAD